MPISPKIVRIKPIQWRRRLVGIPLSAPTTPFCKPHSSGADALVGVASALQNEPKTNNDQSSSPANPPFCKTKPSTIHWAFNAWHLP
jgi:hypothetical protein